MQIGLIVPLLLFFVLLLVVVPKRQIARSKIESPEKRFELENEARKTLAEIFGGLLLIGGLYTTWATLEVSRETQVTDRLTKAFELLADDNEHLEARLGGIYSLERLARDSEDDHWPIMEVLTQLVRERASEKRHNEDVDAYEGAGKPTWALFPWPPPDVQAALTVIGRRSRHYQDGERERLDLHDAVLVGSRLTGAHLEGANLTGVDFGGLLLSDASDEGFQEVTDLSGAHLEGALLDGAYFGRSVLREARLNGASLRGADLSEVVGLSQEQLDTACVGPATLVPPALRKPKPRRR